jgi:hypothetical protein
MAFTIITLAGNYGPAATGTLTFTLTQPMANGGVIIPAQPVVVELDASGGAMFSEYGTLTPNAASGNLGPFNSTAAQLEVFNLNGASEIYFTVGTVASPPAVPVVGGAGCYVVPATLDSYVLDEGLSGSIVVNLISAAAVRFGVVMTGAPQFSVTLQANDDPGTVPQGVWWGVTETITGAQPRDYFITIPAAAPNGTIDISTLTPGQTGWA